MNISGKAALGAFTYTPDVSTMAQDRTVKLTVTGKVHGASRTLFATIRRGTFLDFLYFTDYETKDPAAYVSPPDPYTPSQAQTNCAKHYYEGLNPACVDIFFTTNDVLNGPMHSNDAININGSPQFKGDASTSWNDPTGKRWLGSGSPTFVNPGDPKYRAPLTLPPSNSALKALADGTQGARGACTPDPHRSRSPTPGRWTSSARSASPTTAGARRGPAVRCQPTA